MPRQNRKPLNFYQEIEKDAPIKKKLATIFPARVCLLIESGKTDKKEVKLNRDIPWRKIEWKLIKQLSGNSDGAVRRELVLM